MEASKTSPTVASLYHRNQHLYKQISLLPYCTISCDYGLTFRHTLGFPADYASTLLIYLNKQTDNQANL